MTSKKSAMHQAVVARQAKRIEELETALLETTREKGEIEQRRFDEQASANAMREMLMRERYEALLVKQERNALRKTLIVLIETGRFPGPSRPLTVEFDADTRQWNIAGAAIGGSIKPPWLSEKS